MSTALLGKDRFENIAASLIYHALKDHAVGSCSVVGGDIFRAFKHDPWGRPDTISKSSPELAQAAREKITAAIRATAFDWARVNYNAHVVRYEEAPGIPGGTETRVALARPNWKRGRVLSLPELLKALRALHYNCDAGAATGPALALALPVLDDLIDSLKDACLELLPEYAAAEWPI